MNTEEKRGYIVKCIYPKLFGGLSFAEIVKLLNKKIPKSVTNQFIIPAEPHHIHKGNEIFWPKENQQKNSKIRQKLWEIVFNFYFFKRENEKNTNHLKELLMDLDSITGHEHKFINLK